MTIHLSNSLHFYPILALSIIFRTLEDLNFILREVMKSFFNIDVRLCLLLNIVRKQLL